jgi:periplasmic copper chaperone A
MEVLSRLSLVAALTLTAAGCSRPAEAPAEAAPQVVATRAWIRTPPPGAKNAAGYVVLTNAGKGADTLTGASSPVADMVMLHRSYEEGGMAKMDHVEALPLPAGMTATLKPGAHHLMIMGLKAPLADGAAVPITLRFERSGERQVQFVVQPAAPR